MIAYCISGIGADPVVFETLDIGIEKIPILWVDTDGTETLQDYAKKLTEQIDTSNPFLLIGVSYGGMLACAINEFVKPEKTILISSVAEPMELPLWIRLAGKTGLINVIPSFLFYMPPWFLIWFFQIKDEITKKRIRAIIGNIDRSFTKQSIKKILKWKGKTEPAGLVRIHGDRDWLLPAPRQADFELIEDAGHFMIVDRAKEVGDAIRKILS